VDLGFDVGGIDIEDVNLSDFDLQLGYDEETRYCKPKLQALKHSQIMYENAMKLASEVDIREKQRHDVIVSGNFIFGDFIEAFVKHWNVKCLKMTISTLSLSQDNIDSLENLLRGGVCGRTESHCVRLLLLAREKKPDSLYLQASGQRKLSVGRSRHSHEDVPVQDVGRKAYRDARECQPP